MSLSRARRITWRTFAIPGLLAVTMWIVFAWPRGTRDLGPKAGATPAANALAAAPEIPTTTPARAEAIPDLDGAGLTDAESCLIDVSALRLGSTGHAVDCLQRALVDGRYLTAGIAAPSTFDDATLAAVEKMQTDRKLFVDGVIGRESALSLGIWPDEQSFVVRTPPPTDGAVDLLGYPLSSVASTGGDAPPLPPNSGSGRRLVYHRAGQRVWAIDDDEQIIRSWLVSGSKYSNELPGTHEVYSRSEESTAWNGQAKLPLMVRWLKTERGAIGFPFHPDRHRRWQALPNRRRTRHPTIRWLPATSETRRPLSLGLRRNRHQSRRRLRSGLT